MDPFRLGITIQGRNFAAVLLLVSNTVSWYYIAQQYLKLLLSNVYYLLDNVTEATVMSVYFIFILFSAVMGATLSAKTGRASLLSVWILFGMVVGPLSFFIGAGSIYHLIFIAAIFGVGAGFGVPLCLAYFRDFTSNEERGRIAGIITFVTFLLVALIMAIPGNLNLPSFSLMAAIWKGWGLIAIPQIHKLDAVKAERAVSYYFIIREKLFVLYFIPWIAFCTIDALDTPIVNTLYPPETMGTLMIIQYFTGAIFCLLSGYLADNIGRRPTISYAMILFGVGFLMILTLPLSLSWLFLSVAYGIAWGTLTVIYLTVVWGDIGPYGASEKYYSLGIVPDFLAQALGRFFETSVALFSPTFLFSVSTFAIFCMTIPMLFVGETLDKEAAEMRRIRSYIKEGKRAV